MCMCVCMYMCGYVYVCCSSTTLFPTVQLGIRMSVIVSAVSCAFVEEHERLVKTSLETWTFELLCASLFMWHIVVVLLAFAFHASNTESQCGGFVLLP